MKKPEIFTKGKILKDTEKRERALWLLTCLILVIYALLIAVMSRPAVWDAIAQGVGWFTFILLLTGLFVLVILFCAYLIHRVVYRLRQEIIEDERLKILGQATAYLSHEINNALTITQGYLLMASEMELPPELKNDLAIVRDKQEAIHNLLTDLLLYSGLGRSPKEPVDLRAVIMNSLLQMNPLFARSNIAVQQKIPETPLMIQANTNQLNAVFVNIFKNAVEAMGTSVKKELTLECRPSADEYLILIANSGPLIPSEVKKHLFEPFFTTKESGRGTGLGLRICKNIIADHNGQIWIENRPNQEGVRVVIKLPSLKEKPDVGTEAQNPGH